MYHVVFNVWEAHCVTFSTQIRVTSSRSLTSFYLIKLESINKYMTSPYADHYVQDILVKFQFTIFPQNKYNRPVYKACLFSSQSKDLLWPEFLQMDILLNSNYSKHAQFECNISLNHVPLKRYRIESSVISVLFAYKIMIYHAV